MTEEEWLTGEDAREMLGRYELRSLGGPTRGLSDALKAWSVELTTGGRRHVDRVALFGEAGPEGLREAWPELVAFVERAPEV